MIQISDDRVKCIWKLTRVQVFEVNRVSYMKVKIFIRILISVTISKEIVQPKRHLYLNPYIQKVSSLL